MEGRNVLHVRKASSHMTTVRNNANNGPSKCIYAHAYRVFSLESFGVVVKGKCSWVAVVRLTTSQLLWVILTPLPLEPWTRRQLPLPAGSAVTMMTVERDREGGRGEGFYFSLHLFLCLSSVTADPGWQIFILHSLFFSSSCKAEGRSETQPGSAQADAVCGQPITFIGGKTCRLSPHRANLMHNSK